MLSPRDKLKLEFRLKYYCGVLIPRECPNCGGYSLKETRPYQQKIKHDLLQVWCFDCENVIEVEIDGMVDLFVNVYQCNIKGKDYYFIDNTKPYDDETWFRRIEWDKSTNTISFTEDYWSGDSLPELQKVPKVYCHLKKKLIVLANILEFKRKQNESTN